MTVSELRVLNGFHSKEHQPYADNLLWPMDNERQRC